MCRPFQYPLLLSRQVSLSKGATTSHALMSYPLTTNIYSSIFYSTSRSSCFSVPREFFPSFSSTLLTLTLYPKKKRVSTTDVLEWSRCRYFHWNVPSRKTNQCYTNSRDLLYQTLNCLSWGQANLTVSKTSFRTTNQHLDIKQEKSVLKEAQKYKQSGSFGLAELISGSLGLQIAACLKKLLK